MRYKLLFKYIINFLLFVFSLIIAFIIAESIIRARMSHLDEISLYVASENPKIIYELNPAYPQINSFGIRDKPFNKEELNGKYVIAVIGDSHTYSVKSEDSDNAYPKRIEHHLNKISQNQQIKVLNFGVPGYNTAQELEVLKNKALKFSPNLVILQYTINDTHVSNYLQPKYRLINTLIHKSTLITLLWKQLLYSNFQFFEFIGKNFPDALLLQEGLVGTIGPDADEEPARQGHPPRTKNRVPKRYHYMLGRNNWEKNIREFAEICKQNNIALLATGFIGKSNRELFLKEGFDIYSFSEIFANTDTLHYGYNSNNTGDHFNDEGSDYIGKALANYIHNELTH